VPPPPPRFLRDVARTVSTFAEPWRNPFLVRCHLLRVPDVSAVHEDDGAELPGRQLRSEDHPSLTESRVAKQKDGVVQINERRLNPDVRKVVSRVLACAVDDECISRNPAARLSVPQIRQEEPRTLSISEVERLADAIDPRSRALVLVGAYSALPVVGARRAHGGERGLHAGPGLGGPQDRGVGPTDRREVKNGTLEAMGNDLGAPSFSSLRNTSGSFPQLTRD
jgi:hypothetical protein